MKTNDFTLPKKKTPTWKFRLYKTKEKINATAIKINTPDNLLKPGIKSNAMVRFISKSVTTIEIIGRK